MSVASRSVAGRQDARGSRLRRSCDRRTHAPPGHRARASRREAVPPLPAVSDHSGPLLDGTHRSARRVANRRAERDNPSDPRLTSLAHSTGRRYEMGRVSPLGLLHPEGVRGLVKEGAAARIAYVQDFVGELRRIGRLVPLRARQARRLCDRRSAGRIDRPGSEHGCRRVGGGAANTVKPISAEDADAAIGRIGGYRPPGAEALTAGGALPGAHRRQRRRYASSPRTQSSRTGENTSSATESSRATTSCGTFARERAPSPPRPPPAPPRRRGTSTRPARTFATCSLACEWSGTERAFGEGDPRDRHRLGVGHPPADRLRRVARRARLPNAAHPSFDPTADPSCRARHYARTRAECSPAPWSASPPDRRARPVAVLPVLDSSSGAALAALSRCARTRGAVRVLELPQQPTVLCARHTRAGSGRPGSGLDPVTCRSGRSSRRARRVSGSTSPRSLE